ncbi:MAG: hypothetical protein C4531_07420 [Desulfurivibrio sp.]|nr:MAG: hypothetical protein C4531_07420 [Desulfurivibrio sp.]
MRNAAKGKSQTDSCLIVLERTLFRVCFRISFFMVGRCKNNMAREMRGTHSFQYPLEGNEIEKMARLFRNGF